MQVPPLVQASSMLISMHVAIDALNPYLSHVNSNLPCQNCCPKSKPIAVAEAALALA